MKKLRTADLPRRKERRLLHLGPDPVAVGIGGELKNYVDL